MTVIEEILFFILPVVLLWLVPRLLNIRIIVRGAVIKTPDLLVPFLMVGIHVLSTLFFHQSWLPYFVIFILSFGIVVVSIMAYRKGEILFSRFFKVFWRFSFIFAFLCYYVILLLKIGKQFI